MLNGSLPPDEEEALERADRLISEGVNGDRDLIASMIVEAVTAERDRCVGKLLDRAQKSFEQRDPGIGNLCRSLARLIENR